jgi:hypothetical protein
MKLALGLFAVLIIFPVYIFGLTWLAWKAYMYGIVLPFHTPEITYWQAFAILVVVNIIGGMFKSSHKSKG